MNDKNSDPNHPVGCDRIEAQIDPFIASLKAAGYAANTICTKRAALRRFVSWRRRLKRSATEPDESEVAEFMASASQLGPKHRCLASVALLGFLEHLRRHEVITRCAPEAMTSSSALESRWLVSRFQDQRLPTSRHLLDAFAVERRRVSGVVGIEEAPKSRIAEMMLSGEVGTPGIRPEKTTTAKKIRSKMKLKKYRPDAPVIPWQVGHPSYTGGGKYIYHSAPGRPCAIPCARPRTGDFDQGGNC